MAVFPPHFMPPELQALLSPGEQVIWWGKPQPTAGINGGSLSIGLMFLMIGLIVAGFGIVAIVVWHSVVSIVEGAIWLVVSYPLLAVGCVGLWGAFTTSKYLERTSYAITQTRALKCVGRLRAGSPPKVSYAPLSSLAQCIPMKSPYGSWRSVQLRFLMTDDTLLAADPALFGGGPNRPLVWGLGFIGSGRTTPLPGQAPQQPGPQLPAAPAVLQYARITFSQLTDIRPVMALLDQYNRSTTWVP